MIAEVRPSIDGGRYAVKRVAGEPLEVRAIVLCDGSDVLRGELLWQVEGACDWNPVPLRALGDDVFGGVLTVTEPGRYRYSVRARIDRLGTWRRDQRRRVEGGVSDTELRSEMDDVLARLGGAGGATDDEARRLAERLRSRLAAFLRPEKPVDRAALLEALSDPDWEALAARTADPGSEVRLGADLPLVVESPLAGFSAWYEFFPRSTGEAGAHGTFDTALGRLEYAAAMGFDVVYLPPIHPIGRLRRKGRNNAPLAGDGDVGSPWAIGTREGGHRTVHPELGGEAAFARFVARARELGVAVAIDLAWQCAPDHPWVTEHPEWFRRRADGTIRTAENPPKRYDDIHPLDFEGEAWRSLWDELRGIVLHWAARGVTVFRVDNPHTKPLPFWEWLITEVRARHPEAVFLAEAFTRPALLKQLAKAGFSQSYTYFTWRNSRVELESYLTELTRTEQVEYLRPNLWPNTPDILPAPLQGGRRAAFVARAVLAATLSPVWGIYGPAFELLESRAREPGSEEYLDSEKYELREWDVARPDSLGPVIARLNRIRRECPAFRAGRTLEFLPVTNEQLIAYAKRDPETGERVIVAVNLDPHHRQSGWVELPLAAWGMAPDRAFAVHDLLSDERYLWQGRRNYIELDPERLPAHVLRFVARPAGERESERLLG